MKQLGILFLLINSVVCYSQQGPFGYYRDALLFGQSNKLIGSTARIQGIGGAQVALGGDLSSIAGNPAGLGMFNRSVFAFTPSLNFTTTDSQYGIPDQEFQGRSSDSFNNNFNLANIGTVINFSKGDYSKDKFKGGSLGISLSRIANFNRQLTYRGVNEYSSIIDSFISGAGQTVSDDLLGFEAGAYEQYLINPTFDTEGNVTGYDSFLLSFPQQSESIEESGSAYQMNISWGGNYDDRFYFGGGMGVQLLNYSQRRLYDEFDFVEFDNDGNDSPDPFINSISLADDVETRGAGVNFNLGAIVRPIPFLLIGVNYVSPTFLSFDEESFFDLSADWVAGTTITETDEDGVEFQTDISTIEPFRSDIFVNEYNLRSPGRISTGATLFVGKGGFLTGDVEFVNYSSASLKSNDFIPDEDNDLIESNYRSVMNIRVGGEYRFDHFRLRAGYSVLPSPYQNSDLQQMSSLSFGFGYRTRDYYLDFAVVNSERVELYSPYEVSIDQPVVTTDVSNTAATVTFGLTF